mmetsp:Transcript_10155/g.14810  ORF Transcript_10155/g.14810 Transcript_10155/m.14810 type:complete len:203 (-) Transcript_10155:80-688(-)
MKSLSVTLSTLAHMPLYSSSKSSSASASGSTLFKNFFWLNEMPARIERSSRRLVFPAALRAKGIRKPCVDVTGLYAAFGCSFPPLSGTQTSFPSVTVTGQNRSSDDLRNPTVSRTGDHSNDLSFTSLSLCGDCCCCWQISIESIPSLSITFKALSSLKPAHNSCEPGASADRGPEATVVPDTPSYTVYPSFCVPSSEGFDLW